MVQQRFSPTSGDIFSQFSSNYANGFGTTSGRYWLGNDRLNQLTTSTAGGVTYRLRIDVQSADNNRWFCAVYDQFSVRTAASNYMMTAGGYHGTAGDGLSSGYAFITSAAACPQCFNWASQVPTYPEYYTTTMQPYDKVQYCYNQPWIPSNGGFWYKNCQYTNDGLNGGFTWSSVGRLKASRMWLQPSNCRF